MVNFFISSYYCNVLDFRLSYLLVSVKFLKFIKETWFIVLVTEACLVIGNILVFSSSSLGFRTQISKIGTLMVSSWSQPLYSFASILMKSERIMYSVNLHTMLYQKN